MAPMNRTPLRGCPCGQVPAHIECDRHPGRWVTAWPTCCGLWQFQVQANEAQGPALYELAARAWDALPRSGAVLSLVKVPTDP